VQALGNRLRYQSNWLYLKEGVYKPPARLYHSKYGVFLEEDPLRIPGRGTLYTYAAQNPVAQVDPYGLACCSSTPPRWYCCREWRRVHDILGYDDPRLCAVDIGLGDWGLELRKAGAKHALAHALKKPLQAAGYRFRFMLVSLAGAEVSGAILALMVGLEACMKWQCYDAISAKHHCKEAGSWWSDTWHIYCDDDQILVESMTATQDGFRWLHFRPYPKTLGQVFGLHIGPIHVSGEPIDPSGPSSMTDWVWRSDEAPEIEQCHLYGYWWRSHSRRGGGGGGGPPPEAGRRPWQTRMPW